MATVGRTVTWLAALLVVMAVLAVGELYLPMDWLYETIVDGAISWSLFRLVFGRWTP